MINAVEITPDDLKKMQKFQLEMLIEIDRICRKHNIKYNLSGGSLLGAVRHHGFIPWDDDIDIRMLRPEYERFREVCRTDLNQDKYYFQNIVDEPEYRWGFSRLLLNNSTFVRCGQEHLKCRTGIFVDIFPTDIKADNPLIFRYQSYLALFLRKALWSPVGCVTSTNPIFKMWFTLLSKIPKDALLKLQQHLINVGVKYGTTKTACFGIPGSKLTRWGFSEKSRARHGLELRHYQNLIEVPFEGVMVFIPEYYDEWLSRVYGTHYMQLPPPEKRTIHHYVSEYKFPEE